MGDTVGVGKMESYKELEQDPESYYAVWNREIRSGLKHYEKYWQVSERIMKRYRDEAEGGTKGVPVRLNLFWSNVQVLKSTLYARPPKVDVSRIYRDFTDDVARVAGVIMERLLNHDLEKDTSDFDTAARQGIDDWLIVGEGQVWYRFDPTIEKQEQPPMMDPMGQPMGEPQQVEVVTDAQAPSDYVQWRDFLCSPARTWQEVRWVARRVYMDYDALAERFGEDMAKLIPLQSKTSKGANVDAREDDPWACAEVWEIWCKTNRRVYWCVLGFEKFLDLREDPLGLEGFFPCPCPLLANQTNNTLIPRADYSMARHQYEQIDIITMRLSLLVDACKVVGAYDKEAGPTLGGVLNTTENKMIPIENWALFGEKGGIKGVMDFVPIDMIAAVIVQLRTELAEKKQELYETLGIADIMRGATRATETATAQQIKAQFGSTRLQFKQFEVGRFVRDAQRIKAEIIAKHYPPEVMIERSNIMQTPDGQLAQQAVALLKEGGVAKYRLSIDADSMAALDWAAERDARTQFMQAIGGFVTAVMPLAQAKPESIPMLLQLMQWGLAGFRVGKDIEGAMDQAIQQMSQAGQAPPSPQEQAGLEKTKSESAKNFAQAEKSKADAGKARIQGVTDLAKVLKPGPPEAPGAYGAGDPMSPPPPAGLQ